MNRKSHEDSKPPARDTLTGNTDASENRAGQVIVAECSGQNEEVSISLYARGNTKEFSHALNLLPTERIPMYTREFDSILTFPEKFMLMMVYIERTSSNAGRKMEKEAICWTQNGTVVVVRDTNDLYLKWLRRFFGSLKYESFIRKIYRWGFRKSPSISYALPPTCHVFSNTNFCRDQADRLCEMKSTTAAKGHSAVKMPEVTDQPEQNRALGQSSNRAVEATWNSVPNPGNPFLSLSDPQQHYPRPHVSSHASLLEQHLRSVQVRTHLSYLMLFQLRNDAIYGNDTLDLLALRLRLNQPLEPQAPSILDLVQLLRQQNTIRPMQSPNATLDELIRRLRQNSHR